MLPDRPSPNQLTAALLCVQTLFGLNYVLSKRVLESFPPLVWASARLWVSAFVMLGIAWLLRRERRPVFNREFLLPLLLFTLLGTVINQACFLVGLRHSTSTNSAVLNTLTPLFTLLFVIARGGEAVTRWKVWGFVSAFLGVLVLRRLEAFSLSDETLFGDFLTLVNCLSFALFLGLSHNFLRKHDRLWVTALMFCSGAVIMTLLALPDWAQFTPPEMDTALALHVAYAILGGTLVTYFLQNWALAFAPATSVALLIYVQPLVAAAFGYFWLGTEVTWRILAATGLIFLGMALATRKQRGFV